MTPGSGKEQMRRPACACACDSLTRFHHKTMHCTAKLNTNAGGQGLTEKGQDRKYSDKGQTIVSPPESREYLGERYDLPLVYPGRLSPTT